MKEILGWSAHAYTALGLVCAAGIAVLVVRGGDAAFRGAFMLMIAATLIDATDGWWARRVEVEKTTPRFDGRRLDDLIDFLTYTCLPLLLVWRAGLLGELSGWWLIAPLVASAYGFCQVEAKTADHYFLGFPSYWNVIALYLYVLGVRPLAALAVLLFFSALTFVPFRYLYPSFRGPGTTFVILFGSVWAFCVLLIVGLWQDAPRLLVVASLSFPAYYIAASWAISIRRWKVDSRESVSR